MRTTQLLWIGAALLATSMATSGPAFGQYKSIGPDGRVTYSDQPPAPNARVVGRRDLNTGPGEPSLPYELLQAIGKFPVTLYTGEQCAACDQGRTFLRSRGIPFTEKTVKSNEDIVMLKRISSESTIPVLTLGNQKRVGYSEFEWRSALDAAGYPATSKLPSTYIASPAQSLAPPVAPPAAAAAPAAPAEQAGVEANSDTSEAPTNAPPGFRF